MSVGVRIGLVIAAGWVVLWIAGALFTPSWGDIQKTCEEEGMDRYTCVCIVKSMEYAGYEPEDVEGEDYDQGAFSVALSCL